MRMIPIRYAKEGMYLAQTLNDKNNQILLHKGVELTNGLIRRIMINGIYSIYINDEYSDGEMEDIISPKLRNESIKAVKQTFDNFSNYLNQSKGSIKAKIIAEKKEKGIQSLKDISKDIVDEILQSKDLMINLVDIKNVDTYTYQHSVNVAILALTLGAELGLNKIELNELCVGAVLHDIGKILIPEEILFKTTELTEEELSIEREHTKKGYEYLKDQYDLKTSAKLIALQHHERVDGTGYPNGYKEDKINKLAKIVAITNCYDELTSDGSNKRAIPPNEAIEFIMGSAGRYFDFHMVKSFSKIVVPYPEGSLVRLSNKEIGVIEEVKPEFPLRPKVKIIKQRAISIEMQMVDLMKEKNIVIVEQLYEVPNASVPHYLGADNSFMN